MRHLRGARVVARRPRVAAADDRPARQLPRTPRTPCHDLPALRAGSPGRSEIAAAELREATAGIEHAYSRIAAAWSHNGRIVWHREPPEPAAWTRRLADPSAYGALPAADSNAGLAR
ncbi:hypothetical protein FTX61_13615 [Nitriliruptoraceae bacterium ZYF776]|nr:hypothetical protein [Profundirhabdus halotolerans]